MKKLLCYLGVVALCVVLFGCEKMSSVDEELSDGHICGSQEFFASIQPFSLPMTKSGEVSEEELTDGIVNMLPLAKQYLADNGYDYSEDFQDGDPNIVIAALALYEYDLTLSMMTKSSPSVYEHLTCLVIGKDFAKLAESLAKSGAKVISKEVAKLVAKKAVKKALPKLLPIAGTAITVYGYIECLQKLNELAEGGTIEIESVGAEDGYCSDGSVIN